MKKPQYTPLISNKKEGFPWGLTVFAVLVISALIGLGHWQWHRAGEKANLLDDFAKKQKTPTFLMDKISGTDWVYRHVRVHGAFHIERVFYHMSRFYQHHYGYELLVPFQMQAGQWLLVNMGWLPDHVLPKLEYLKERHDIEGVFLPGQHSAISFKAHSSQWPRQILVSNVSQLEKMASIHFYPLILKSNKPIVNGRYLPVQLTSIKPVRHKAYALQWFSFAGIALIIYMILMRRRREEHG